MHASRPPRGDFLLASCQGGAEAALVERQRAVLPRLARGAWRRGIVTFRLAADAAAPATADLAGLIFARTVIHSCGQVTGDVVAELVNKLHLLAGPSPWDDVHVWSRDPRQQSDPSAVRTALIAALDPDRRSRVADQKAGTKPDALVLDCVIDSPGRWWVGWHVADSPSGRWPGGVYPGTLPADKVSRAWLKLDEAIATFGIDLEPGHRALELGAAPGGACQRLLEAGLAVVGIDPALVDERVSRHPQFEQWRMRARDVKLRQLRGFDWVVADMNIDPNSTLDALERVVLAASKRPRGIIATLKVPNWSRTAELPEWLGRFSAWGYAYRARQLSTGGREICVVAERGRPGRTGVRPRSLRHRPRRRPGR